LTRCALAACLGDLWQLFEKHTVSWNAIPATPLKTFHGQSQ